MQFWRIYNNQIFSVGEVDKLGWSIDDACGIPQEYIDRGEFIVYRTCFSLGDWGIITVMPRLLKQKYPHCKVYLPSTKLITEMFGMFTNWNHHLNPFANPDIIFQNNPYVDGTLDSIEGEVFHDHYRIYDPSNPQEPLIKQMLRFWRFEDWEMNDVKPELYFTDDEIKLGQQIINSYIPPWNSFGCLMLSSTTKDRDEKTEDELLLKEIDPSLTYFYYSDKSIEQTPYSYLKLINFKELNLPLRIQLYIRTMALVNIGYETGLTTSLCRYTQVISAIKPKRINSNYFPEIKYLTYE